MAETPRDEHPSSPDSANNAAEDDEPICWICFTSDQDSYLGGWVQPCKCIGTTRWVHHYCLSRWIDEKQRGDITSSVNCPQCRTEYIIFTPELNTGAQLMQLLLLYTKRICPYVAGGIVVSSLYWTAVTYGAVTFTQVLGHEKAIALMDDGDLLVMLVGFPAIPIALVGSCMIQWERLFQRVLHYGRTVGRFFRNAETTEDPALDPAMQIQMLRDPVVSTCTICHALALPTISNLVGLCFYGVVDTHLHRTLLGGVTYLLAKALMEYFVHQQQYRRTKNRIVLDYTEENLAKQALRQQTERVVRTQTE